MRQMYLEEKVDLLLSEQKRLVSLVELFIPDLENEKGVIHFLEITKNTFNTYVQDSVLIEGTHYVKKGNKRVFIPDAIIALKKSGVKGRRKTSKKQSDLAIKKAKLDAVNRKLGIISEYRSAG